jgi:hypothetical protein
MFIYKNFEVNYGVRILCVCAIKIGVNVEKRKCKGIYIFSFIIGLT